MSNMTGTKGWQEYQRLEYEWKPKQSQPVLIVILRLHRKKVITEKGGMIEDDKRNGIC